MPPRKPPPPAKKRLSGRALLLAAAITATAAAPADAGLFGSSKPATATPTAPAAKPDAEAKPAKASAEQRAAAERLDPLTRAAFWQRESTLDPTDVVAALKLSTALRALRRYDEAGQAADRALVVKPDDLEALLEASRARLESYQGFYALDDLTKAMTLAPSDWRPVSLMGVAYEQTKRPAQAQAMWRRALALSPGNPAVLTNMALALASTGQGAQAETLLRQAVASPASGARERQNLALVLGMEGKLAEAEALLRRDLPPDAADADLTYLKAIASAK